MKRVSIGAAFAVAVVAILASLPQGAHARDRGVNQPGAVGNPRADPGLNQPGAVGNVGVGAPGVGVGAPGVGVGRPESASATLASINQERWATGASPGQAWEPPASVRWIPASTSLVWPATSAALPGVR